MGESFAPSGRGQLRSEYYRASLITGGNETGRTDEQRPFARGSTQPHRQRSVYGTDLPQLRPASCPEWCAVRSRAIQFEAVSDSAHEQAYAVPAPRPIARFVIPVLERPSRIKLFAFAASQTVARYARTSRRRRQTVKVEALDGLDYREAVGKSVRCSPDEPVVQFGVEVPRRRA